MAGAWIDVSPLDETLDGGGFAGFERSYPETTEVTLTAPALSHTGRTFIRWLIAGVPQSTGAKTIQIVVDGSKTVKAIYMKLPQPPQEPFQEYEGPPVSGD